MRPPPPMVAPQRVSKTARRARLCCHKTTIASRNIFDKKLLKAMPHDCMPNATILPNTLWQRLQSLHINRQRDVSSASTTTLARVLHVMKCGDYDESGGGREDDFDAGCDDERAYSYIGDTKYVALTGREKGHNLGGMKSSTGGLNYRQTLQSASRLLVSNHWKHILVINSNAVFMWPSYCTSHRSREIFRTPTQDPGLPEKSELSFASCDSPAPPSRACCLFLSSSASLAAKV